MAMTTADLLIERLIGWGVDTVFGLPGDGINGIFESLRTRQDRIRFIQVRHEEAAAFAACGYAKYTGRLGVCLATSGPGGIHLLNGLYDAKLDNQPVLAITGHTFHDLIGAHYQQDVDLDKLFTDVAVFNERVMGPAHVVNMVDAAVRHAIGRRGVAHLTIPKDIQDWTSKDEERSKANIPHHSGGDGMMSVQPMPTPDELRRAAEVLNAGTQGRDAGRARLPRRARRGHGDRRSAGRAGRQGAAGQGGPARRQPVHDRRHRPAGHGAFGRRDEGMRHVAAGRHELPVHRVPAQAGQGAHGADRRRRRRASARATRSRSAWSATAAASWRRCCRCSSAKTDRSFLETRAEAHARVERADGDARDARHDADEAAGGGRGAGSLPGRRRDHRGRLRHGDHLGGPPPAHPRAHAVQRVGVAGHHGQRAAVRDRGGGGLSGPAGRRRLWRRRPHDADGRAGDDRQVQAADQDRGLQEQRARRDQVGAAGDGGQPVVRRRPSADRLRRRRARLRHPRLHAGTAAGRRRA